MSNRKIMSIIGLCLMVLLLIGLFIPYFDNGYQSYNLWEYFEESDTSFHILVLIELIISIILLVLQICGVMKDTKLALLPAGFLMTWNLGLFLKALENNFDPLSIGFYLSLILSVAVTIVLCIGGLLSNDKKQKMQYGPTPTGFDPQTGQPIYAQPTGFDPQTGQPIYAQPKRIVGYDPKTGKPIYE